MADLLGRLGARLPILQAPMLGCTTPELITSVANAGAFGFLPLASTPAQDIAPTIARLRRRCDRFGVNFFVVPPPPEPGSDEALRLEAKSAAFAAPFRGALGIASPPQPRAAYGESYERQMEALLAATALPRAVSFTFGCPDAAILRALAEKDVVTLVTATSVDEAVYACAAGTHAIVAQGAEAGGHRGTFLGPFDRAMVGTIALVPAVVDACGRRAAVVAAGGIADGRGVAAALALGADAAQVGTAFLACAESGAPAAHKAAVAGASASDMSRVVVTRAHTGRPARGFAGPVTDAEAALPCRGESLPRYPVHLHAMADVRAAAAAQGRDGYAAMWCGQAVGLARGGEAAVDVISRLASGWQRPVASAS